jgi:hypothetical protein
MNSTRKPVAVVVGATSKWQAVVYLCAADKYRRLTHRLLPGQKGLDERARMASQRLSEPW